MTRSAYREAVGYLERALSVLPHLPETPQARELAIDLRFDLRNALFPLAELAEVGRYLHEAEPLCVALGDRRRLALVSGYLTHYLWLTGQSVEARVPAERLAEIAAEVGDFPLLVAADYYRSAAWLASGDRQSETYAHQVVGRLQGDQMLERFGLGVFPAAFARAFLSFGAAERGDFSQGRAVGEEALRLAETVNHPYSLGFNACMLGNVHRVKGDFDRATEYFERGRAVSHEWGLAIMDGFNTGMLGYTRAMTGRTEEGLALLRPAMDLMKKVVFAPLFCALMGEALLVDDQREEARSWAELALRLSRERNERVHEAHALWLLAEIGAGGNDDPMVVGLQYDDCIAMAEPMELNPLVAHCHAGLAKLLGRTGKHIDDAQEHLTIATTKYREMGMTYWIVKAEAEMAARS
jgi:tetratricopeptide (TPR) repeat protein